MFVAVRYDITNRCSAVFVTTIFLDLFVVIGHAGKIPFLDSDIRIMAANISKLHSVQYPTYMGHFPAPLAPNFDRVCVELLCTCHQYSEFKNGPPKFVRIAHKHPPSISLLGRCFTISLPRVQRGVWQRLPLKYICSALSTLGPTSTISLISRKLLVFAFSFICSLEVLPCAQWV